MPPKGWHDGSFNQLQLADAGDAAPPSKLERLERRKRHLCSRKVLVRRKQATFRGHILSQPCLGLHVQKDFQNNPRLNIYYIILYVFSSQFVVKSPPNLSATRWDMPWPAGTTQRATGLARPTRLQRTDFSDEPKRGRQLDSLPGRCSAAATLVASLAGQRLKRTWR